MSAPLAVQLYSVRDTLEKDFEGTIRHLAQIGYIGLEVDQRLQYLTREGLGHGR